MLISAPYLWLFMYWQLMLSEIGGQNTKTLALIAGAPFPFPFRAFLPLPLPFLHLPRRLNKRSLCYLSLVFICWENPRRSGILLFRDCPRFCWLMKTRNRRYHRYRLGWTGTNLENQECLYFPDASQICVMVGDHSRQMKSQICTVGDVGNEFRSLPIP